MSAEVVHTDRKPWHIPEMNTSFWSRVTEAFAEAGLETTQTAIGRYMEVGQSAVGKWASGTGLPTLRKCIEMARITGVNTEWLVSGRGNKKELGGPVDEVTKQLLERLADASPEARREILAFVEFKLTPPPAAPDSTRKQ